jgi:hypothetical protein
MRLLEGAYRGRFSRTAAALEVVEGDTSRLRPLQQPDSRGEDISSEASLNAT